MLTAYFNFNQMYHIGLDYGHIYITIAHNKMQYKLKFMIKGCVVTMRKVFQRYIQIKIEFYSQKSYNNHNINVNI